MYYRISSLFKILFSYNFAIFSLMIYFNRAISSSETLLSASNLALRIFSEETLWTPILKFELFYFSPSSSKFYFCMLLPLSVWLFFRSISIISCLELYLGICWFSIFTIRVGFRPQFIESLLFNDVFPSCVMFSSSKFCYLLFTLLTLTEIYLYLL